MLKKLHLKSVILLFALIVGVGNAWGDEEVYYTLTPASGSNNGYAANCDIDISGITWNLTGNSTLQPWRIGGKSLSSVDRTLYSKTAMGSAISKVEVVVGAASSITVNSVKLTVASDAAFSSTIDEVTTTFSANSTLTFTPTSPKTEWTSGAYYKFTFNVTVSGSSNKYLEFSLAKFYRNAQTIVSAINVDKKTSHGSIRADKATANVGDPVTLTADPDEGYALGEWTVLDGNAHEVAVNIVNENVATFLMPATAVEVSATFVEKHTVTYYVAGESKTVSRAHGTTLSLGDPAAVAGMPFAGWSLTNTATAPNVANSTVVNSDMTVYAVFAAQARENSYVKVNTVSEGDYLIVYEKGSKAFNGGLTTLDAVSNFVPVTISDDKIAITPEMDAAKFTIAEMSGGYSIKSASGKYIGKNAEGNGLDASDSELVNTVSFDTNEDAVIRGAGGCYVRFNSNSNQNRFRYYGSGQQPVALYKRTVKDDVYSLGTTETLTVTGAGYATYCTPSALRFTGDEKVKAYKATASDDEVTFKQVTGLVAAGTGLLLAKKDGGSCAVTVVGAGESLSGNALVGVTEATVIHGTSGNYYVLQQKGENVGFYKVASANYTVRANSAYLALPASAKEFIGFGDETAVEAVAAEVLPTGTAYNLQGQRVGNDYKGVVIVNGKKVIR